MSSGKIMSSGDIWLLQEEENQEHIRYLDKRTNFIRGFIENLKENPNQCMEGEFQNGIKWVIKELLKHVHPTEEEKRKEKLNKINELNSNIKNLEKQLFTLKEELRTLNR